MFVLDKILLELFRKTGEFFYMDTVAGGCVYLLLGAYAWSIARGKRK